MLIRYRSHDTADGQTVKIIINKDQNAEQDRHKLCAYSCLDMTACPFSECAASTSLIHQGNHATKKYQKYQNTYIIGIG